MRTFFWVVVMAIIGSAMAEEKIRVEEKLFGPNFYLKDSLLQYDDLNAILSKSENTRAYVNTAKRYALVGNIVGGTGAGIFIFGVGYSIIDRDPKWSSLSLGMGTYVASTLFSNYFYNKNIRMAVDIYNGSITCFCIQPGRYYRLAFSRAIL